MKAFPIASPTLLRILRLLIAAIAILLTVWAEWWPAGTATLANEWLRDRFIVTRAIDTPEQRIAVIDIDDASQAADGKWPWSRAQMALLLENTFGYYNARGVALDIVFSEPADGSGDARLASLARNMPLVMAQALDYNGAHQVPLRVGQLSGGVPLSVTGVEPAMRAAQANGYIGNHAGLAQASHTGNIGFVPDRDGVLRRLPVQTLYDGRLYPTLSLALFDCCARASRGAAKTGAAPSLGAPGLHGEDALARLPYARNWSAYTVVAAEDVLHQRLAPDALAGKLVLIGSSSLSLSDRVPTPLDKSISGFMVHAAALSAMLDAQGGQVPAPLPGRAIACLFALAVTLLATYTFPRLSALLNASLLVGASAAWVALAYLLAPHDPAFSTTGPLLSNLFLLVVAVPFAWQLSQRQSRQLLGTLNQYVAREVVDELLRRDIADPLTPGLRTVTTLIADMEGYTTQVETLPVEAAARLTRDFLDCLTGPVLAAHGTLDKYTGDGLVAFWGAPLPNPDHADLALDCAEQILRTVRRFSASREAMGMPRVRVRIGIESGVAMAGDFGSSFRSIYTAVGDSVNTASRLQEAARDLPHDIVIGHGTASRAQRHRLTLLGEKVLRGKEKPTILYTLTATLGANAPADEAVTALPSDADGQEEQAVVPAPVPTPAPAKVLP